MKKKAIVLVLVVLVIACATCFIAFASPPGPPPLGGGFFGGPPGAPPGPPPLGLLGGPLELIEKLKLTDDQLKQIRLVFVDFENKTRKARMALMGLDDEKRTILMSGRIDQTKLAKLDEEITELASEVMGESLKMKRDQLAKLTTEQANLLGMPWAKRQLPADEKTTGK
jgi:hypothetical protein